MFVGQIAKFYIPNWRQFSVDLKNKVNINIRGQIKKGLRGVSGSTSQRLHFEILITPMQPGFNKGNEKTSIS